MRPTSGGGSAGGASNGGGGSSRQLAASPSFGGATTVHPTTSGGGAAGRAPSNGSSSRNFAASPSTPQTDLAAGDSSNLVTMRQSDLNALMKQAGQAGAQAALQEVNSQVTKMLRHDRRLFP